MKPAALATETIDVAAFLAISRKHLGLSSTTPGGANARMALNPFKRHAPVSSVVLRFSLNQVGDLRG